MSTKNSIEAQLFQSAIRRRDDEQQNENERAGAARQAVRLAKKIGRPAEEIAELEAHPMNRPARAW